MSVRSNFIPQIHEHTPSLFQQPILSFQSAHTRALTVGYVNEKTQTFIPARLHFGPLREADTYQATIESLRAPQIQTILKNYSPDHISTITLMRETLACHLNMALMEAGIVGHFGDAFIGATHVKGDGAIRTAYLYENTEGLAPEGLWLIADSICIGRNLAATLQSLLANFSPKEIILLAPLASRKGINAIGEITHNKKIPTTFIAWGGLFGVDEKTLYDMPWGHPDTEPVDERDRTTYINMYSPTLCVGGDFGNNYYSPTIAKQLYDDQIKAQHIVPHIPTVETIKTTYTAEEILTRSI